IVRSADEGALSMRVRSTIRSRPIACLCVEQLEAREVLSSSSAHFDFGTANSPVAAGYTQVTPATAYTASQGYGWQSGAIQAVDRGSGSDLTRDLNFTAAGTFAADVPNGTYTVTLTL